MGNPSRPKGPGRVVLAIFAIAIVAAGAGFSWKLLEFVEDLLDQEGLQFAGAHLVVYALVAAGFILLLGAAFLAGHFSDVERPKYELLERERDHDRAEFDRSHA